MQACVRLARRGPAATPLAVRRLATTAQANTAATVTATSTRKDASLIPLSNVEAQWERMNREDKLAVHKQLEELQKQDWKKLSIDEKKAAYYIAFGPHGPRAPIDPPGTYPKIILGVGAGLAVTTILWYAIRAAAPPPPKTMTKEWQEAMNERAKEQKLNPITGIASEGYSGKGFVQD